jgi:hypothetical protein
MSEKVPGGELSRQEKDLLPDHRSKSIEARLVGVKMPSPEIGSGALKEKRAPLLLSRNRDIYGDVSGL